MKEALIMLGGWLAFGGLGLALGWYKHDGQE